MIPAFFPFTCISDSIMKRLVDRFDQIIVYLPDMSLMPSCMQQWVDKGHLLPRTPVNMDAALLLQAVKEYRHWADVHSGTDKTYFKSTGNEIPFFDDTSLSRIRESIRINMTKAQPDKNDVQPGGTIKEADDGSTNQNALFQAGLFLQIAQEFDLQNMDVNSNLAEVAEMETSLMKNLKGEEFLFPFKGAAMNAVQPHDPGLYMTPGRLDAWASIIQWDDMLPEFFITTSAVVMEHVLDLAPDAAIAEDLPDEMAFLFPVYQIPDIHPALFFSRFMKKQNASDLKSINFRYLHNHTLIGLLDLNKIH